MLLGQVHGVDAFDLVGETHMVGVQLLVFANKKHRGSISNVSVATAKCGLFGMLGNKGAGLVVCIQCLGG